MPAKSFYPCSFSSPYLAGFLLRSGASPTTGREESLMVCSAYRVIATWLLYFVTAPLREGGVLSFSSLSLFGAALFSTFLLPEITTEDQRDKVSSRVRLCIWAADSSGLNLMLVLAPATRDVTGWPSSFPPLSSVWLGASP